MTENQKPKAKQSAKGFYHYIKEAWKKPSVEKVTEIRNKMTLWRSQERITKVEKPTRLDKARALGYKAKKGIVVFRVTIKRGGRARIRPASHRRTTRMGVKKILKMNYQWVAEQRVQKAYPNLEVLNSYKLYKDGQYFYFEIIAIDPTVPEIKSDSNLNWIIKSRNRNRALRGLTSAGKKSRGLRNKGPELKVRPSANAQHHRGK